MSTFAGKTALITGGTGSFGTKMAAHLLDQGVDELRILSRDEAKQDAMRNSFSDPRLRFFIADVRDVDSMAPAFRGVNLIFQAAALKQVPAAEFFPLEAVKTNIVGSRNVLELGIKNEAESIVCLSTDKAVYPINAMGMTKALMEKVAQSFARSYDETGTRVSVTRYGNVMYSRGSVIPRFIGQIRSGQPITVTDPTMTRFLMSLDESVHLVEHALLHAQPGDLFVRKAPAATIGDLAEAVGQLFGTKLPWETIGFRHGEKLFESLLSSEEKKKSEDQGDFFRVPMDERTLNYEPYFDKGLKVSEESEAYTSHNTRRLSVDEVKLLLLGLPEVISELDGTAA